MSCDVLKVPEGSHERAESDRHAPGTTAFIQTQISMARVDLRIETLGLLGAAWEHLARL